MSFTEPSFFLFLPTVFLLYYFVVPGAYQVHTIILASIIFYGFAQPGLIALLFFAITVNCACGLAIFSHNHRSALFGMLIGVFANISMLFIFKYLHLVLGTYAVITKSEDNISSFVSNIPLPLGISFFAFHGISMVVDAWRARQGGTIGHSRPHVLSYLRDTSLYIAFFPQLVSGPITKSKAFMPQIQSKSFYDIEWRPAFEALLIGYFLKLVVANNLGEYTVLIQYPYFIGQNSISLAALIYAFSIQIFSDFAGYSLIAIGLAYIFDYKLPTNFLFPYIAQSFSEFWNRWHISLSHWLRDYLYIPLGGNRVSASRSALNVMIVMGLGGLWHGAGWSYAVWGLAHGAALVAERPFLGTWFFTSSNPIFVLMRWAIVYAFVTFAWLLFKLPDMRSVGTYLAHLFTDGGFGMNWLVLSVLIFSIPVIFYHVGYLFRDNKIMRLMRHPLQGIMLFLILTDTGPDQPFIYFQF